VFPGFSTWKTERSGADKGTAGSSFIKILCGPLARRF
jgi:hypothetical protein